MSDFKMHRIGLVMEPEPGNPLEEEGVLNPAVIRGKDGELYLFPRLVAKGNFSRIGICKVLFDEKGDPFGVERLGIALEPETEYERRPNGGGGCEDPRITYVEPLKEYVMTYTAFGPNGPRIAVATSKDLFHWERLGLLRFTPYGEIDFNNVANKDAGFFPVIIPSPNETKRIALIHRPLFPGSVPEDTLKASSEDGDREVDLAHESIWISYCDLEHRNGSPLTLVTDHYRLASPVEAWEKLKIGGGAAPFLTRHGWMLVYHGVSEHTVDGVCQMIYSAGVLILSRTRPHHIKYRSREPVLTPETEHERFGIVQDVVFPTGVDRRDDLGSLDRIDIYYGMADKKIGVAQMIIPKRLPQNAQRDAEDHLVAGKS